MSSSWDWRFIALAEHISEWSKDPSTKVGAVLVTDRNLVVGLGYNGFPRGVLDLSQRYDDRETKYKFVVHAEVNAVLMAGDKAKGTTLYVWPSFKTPPVCHECCKVVIQAGIKEIVGLEPMDTAKAERWADSIKVARAMCNEAGVTYRTL